MAQRISLKRIISDNRYFYISYAILLLFGLPMILLLKKGDVLIWLNNHHNQYLDYLFKYSTMLGDGIFFIVIIVVLAIFNFRKSFFALLSYASSGIASQGLKKIFDIDRPLIYFENKLNLYLVPDVHVNLFWSFPSGHSASAFALCLVFAIITPYKKLGIVFIFLGIIISISRVYLVQHFFIDIYFGSLLGVTLTTFAYLLINNIDKIYGARFLKSSLLNIFDLNKKVQENEK